MNVYKRYFRITAGPLMEAAREIEQQRGVAIATLKTFIREVGATDAQTYRDGTVAGFCFDGVACDPVWGVRDSSGVRMPRGNTKEGKALRERIKALPRVPGFSDSLKSIGLHDGPAVINGNRFYRSLVAGTPSLGVLYLCVPWRDIDPRELEEYGQQRDEGSNFSMELDHLLWKPTTDMVEMKEWEVRRDLDEANAQLKARAAA